MRHGNAWLLPVCMCSGLSRKEGGRGQTDSRRNDSKVRLTVICSFGLCSDLQSEVHAWEIRRRSLQGDGFSLKFKRFRLVKAQPPRHQKRRHKLVIIQSKSRVLEQASPAVTLVIVLKTNIETGRVLKLLTFLHVQNQNPFFFCLFKATSAVANKDAFTLLLLMQRATYSCYHTLNNCTRTALTCNMGTP